MFSESPVRHPLRFLFIDFNSYFAAVEQHDDPALAGKPVIVIPIKSEHTGAIAASYAAKAIGISRGTTVRDARRLCPAIAIRIARHDRYVELHNRLMAEIENHLPIARVYSIDECACRLDRREQDPERALAKAREIKAGIAARIGPALRSSIGIAPSPLLAKLAAELKKPDGLTLITAPMLPGVLEGLPLRAIPGIGPGMAARLEKAGISDFLGLWNLPPKQARAIWNSVVGERFVYALRGHDILGEAPGAKAMIGHSRVLTTQDQQPNRARLVARALLLKAASRLRLYGLHAARLSLSIRLRPEGGLGQDLIFTPTRNSWALLKALDELWNRTLQFRPGGARLGLVSIALHDLVGAGPEPDLFTASSVQERDERETGLWARIDDFNRQQGRQIITLASHRTLDLNYLGVKIAFSRVPDPEEFHC